MENHSEESGAPDGKLLREWLEGRREGAFQALVMRYSGLALMTARRTCDGDDSLAAEAAQLTFILLARKARGLQACASLGGWIHRTALMQARNLLRTMRRERRKRAHLIESAVAESPTLPGGSGSESWQALQPVLDEALAALPEKDREAILLRFYRELGVQEVAAVLGITRDAAQKRIDRATEKLRAQFLRRGGALAGGTAAAFSAALASGLAADAQAATVTMTAGFAKTALATGASGAGAASSTGAAAFLTGIGMKTSSMVAAPLVALLAAGIWFASQRQSIGKLEADNAALTKKLSGAGPAMAATGKPRALLPTALDGRPIDWAAVAEEIRTGSGSRQGPGRYLQPAMGLKEQILDMGRDRLLESLDELEAAGLEESSRWQVKNLLYASLAEKDPRAALDLTLAKDGADAARYDLLEIWARQDAVAAGAWLDAQMEAGTLTGKRFPDSPRSNQMRAESALLIVLLRDHPEAASQRLAAIPAEWRREPLYMQREERVLAPEDQPAFAGILREHFTDQQRLEELVRPVTEKEYVGKSTFTTYADLESYLTRIDARPDEIAACVKEIAAKGRFERSPGKAATVADLETFRAWTAAHAPDIAVQVTATALDQMLTEKNYAAVAEYALQRQSAGDGDAVLMPLFTGSEWQDNRELARKLIEKISDRELREEFLRQLNR